ncbi:MAG: hypothetical protein AAFY28_13555 [Actinomycetota bacterium]
MGTTTTTTHRGYITLIVALVAALIATLIATEPWAATAAPGDDDATFVSTAGCRAFDYRPGDNQVGPRSTPLGEGETYTQQITGNVGECTGPLAIPDDAVSVVVNITAVGATAQTNLRMFPANLTEVPLLSNLNVAPGAPPTPNQVDVQLSPSGAIKIFNFKGNVSVLGDIVGYFTKASLTEIDQRLTALEGPTTSYVMIPGADFIPTTNQVDYSTNGLDLRSGLTNTGVPTYYANPKVPDGATVTSVTLYAIDNVNGVPGAEDIQLELFGGEQPGLGAQSLAFIRTDDAEPEPREFIDTTIENALVDLENKAYYISISLPPGAGVTERMVVTAVRIEYTTP